MFLNKKKYLIQTSPSNFYNKNQIKQQQIIIKNLNEQEIINKLQLILLSLRQQQKNIKKMYQEKISSLQTQLCLKQLEIVQINNENQNIKKLNNLLKQKIQKNQQQSLQNTSNIKNYHQGSQLSQIINKNIILSKTQQIFYFQKQSQFTKRSVSNIQNHKKFHNEQIFKQRNNHIKNNQYKNKLQSFLMPLQISTLSLNIRLKNEYIPQNSLELLNKIEKMNKNRSKKRQIQKRFIRKQEKEQKNHNKSWRKQNVQIKQKN